MARPDRKRYSAFVMLSRHVTLIRRFAGIRPTMLAPIRGGGSGSFSPAYAASRAPSVRLQRSALAIFGGVTLCIVVGAGGRCRPHFAWSSSWHTCWERLRFATVAWLLKHARHALKLQHELRGDPTVPENRAGVLLNASSVLSRLCGWRI